MSSPTTAGGADLNVATMNGLELMQAFVRGELPGAPIGKLLDIKAISADRGEVVFSAKASGDVLNPLGLVHGGFVCTLLDSVVGCAVHTTLAPGVGYVSIDLNVNYLRAPGVGEELTAKGTVTRPGNRVAFAQGEIRNAEDKLVATATGSCLVIGAEK